MSWKDLKYLLAYTVPLTVYLGLLWGGVWVWSTILTTFVAIPILELVLPLDERTFTDKQKQTRTRILFFDFLLYFNVVLVYFLIYFFGTTMGQGTHSISEWIALTISMGVLFGANGINVAHELGHREQSIPRFIAKMLLLPSFYMHFIIEHNRGHHKYVATPEDPASARWGESLYRFWWRSTSQSYLSAWRLENERLKGEDREIMSPGNAMIIFTMVQITYIIVLYVMFSLSVFFALVVAGVIGFSLLEFINYIEHYGLVRQKTKMGVYERLNASHSWNSRHPLGKMILYELTLHSDHHQQTTKKYQILEHIERSPELPAGYPGSIILAHIPPLWFKVMHPKIEAINSQKVT